ncbi:MAG: ABC transporter permease [Candidatus Aminicenantes bacterium RBG_16_63_16]|nr:MAG: ABC transporter permease [Candidatus Aminicenantes bacterium RBG_16_63_16]
MILKLALRNLLGAGLRTWLNVIVLSFAFMAIIWTQGLYEGMNDQGRRASVEAALGGGQYWQKNYDPYDVLSLEDAHAVVPDFLRSMIDENKATAVLVVQGTLYPQGRIHPVLVKGIDPGQAVLTLPAHFLKTGEDRLPALIGSRLAKSTGLGVGDTVTLRWRDAKGTFDARDLEIVQVMKTVVQSIDQGQVWLPLERLRKLAAMEGQASLVVLDQGTVEHPPVEGWVFRDLDYLLSDIKQLVQMKSAGATILYTVLILLAMLAIFDTQVLSIFRRRKEMGTLMALGFTRGRLIRLFTLEGALHGVLAAAAAALYGIPFLTWYARQGWAVPESMDSYGFAIGERLFPVYGAGLVAGTTILVLVITTIVSYLPTRRIARLKPTEALRGRMS